MADALCGPSNALQNFQKHSTVDRTLQQDRLTSRHLQSQGFRSSPGPIAGLLDPEFEAFQAGQIPLPPPEAQHFHQAGFPSSYAPQQLNQNASATWALDFQQLSVADPASPQFQQRDYAQQSQPWQAGNGWQNEFAKQHSQAVGPAPSNYAGYNSIPFQRLSTIAPMAPLQAPNYAMTASHGPLDQSQAQSIEAFDEEAFARAFDQAAQSELAMEQAAQLQDLGFEQDVLVNESAERLMGSDQVQETHRLGADLIHDPREGEGDQRQQDDPDALARTAGQLLDSVKDNHSDKFQKSQFLELMRQLRDREVMVEGDKIVGVQFEDSSGHGKEALEKSLLSIARQLSHLDFARVEPLLAAKKPTHSFRPVTDQLILGAFIRTLMHASAALELLLSQHPDLLERAKPFGMSIGVEVFALARNPLMDAYPALRGLVMSFKSQFLQLGIDPGMVRRATDGGDDGGSVGGDKAAMEGGGEAQLRTWLADWLGSISARRWRGGEWLFSAGQVRELLGADIYPFAAGVGAGTAEGRETGPRPTRQHVDRIRDILGPHVLSAMVNIWISPHTRFFANPLVAGVEDFAAYVADVACLDVDKAEGDTENEVELDLDRLFPKSSWRVDMEEQLRDLEQWGREQVREQERARALSMEELLQEQNPKHRLRGTVPERERIMEEMTEGETMRRAAAAAAGQYE